MSKDSPGCDRNPSKSTLDKKEMFSPSGRVQVQLGKTGSRDSTIFLEHSHGSSLVL